MGGSLLSLGVSSAPPFLSRQEEVPMAQAMPPWIQVLQRRDPKFVDAYMAQREHIMSDGAIPAKYSAAFAISSASPIRPSGTDPTMFFLNSSICCSLSPRPLIPGVSIGPGLIALTRILRALRSTVQLRANDRTAALVALYTLKPSRPLEPAIDAFRMIDPPSRRSGSAFCTVKSRPLTLLLNVVSKCSSVIAPSGASAPPPALAKTTSRRPFSRRTVSYRSEERRVGKEG